MKYIINKEFGLRSWQRLPRYVVSKHLCKGKPVSEEEFETLKKCDGKTDLEMTDVLKKLMKFGLVQESDGTQELTEWQKHKSYDCIFTPTIYFRITGICNLNCLHCFNAADINRDFSRWTYDEFKKLIKEAKEIGILGFEITGGEPLTNPDFMKIVKEIYANDMVVASIVTNGHFITQEFLDELKALDCKTDFRISFDSFGHHDWIRQQEGAEKIAIDSIKLCIKNGFRVLINMQANRVTMDTILESAEFFDSIGVETLRIIKTTETPRWRDYSGDANFTIQEYFDFCVDFLKNYYKKERKMNVILWSFGKFSSQYKSYILEGIRCNLNEYSDKAILCSQQRFKVAVGSDGALYPCHQTSGVYDEAGIVYPNVKEVGLKQAILDKEYIKDAHKTTGEFVKTCQECRECIHFRQCWGGCRVLAFIFNKGAIGPDITKCEFFKGNYADKVAAALPKDFKPNKKMVEDASYYTGDLEVLNSCDA